MMIDMIEEEMIEIMIVEDIDHQIITCLSQNFTCQEIRWKVFLSLDT